MVYFSIILVDYFSIILYKDESENINLFGENEYYEKEFGVDYRMKFTQNKKTNPIIFELSFGYIMDKDQNAIYFQLFEHSQSSLLKSITFNDKFRFKEEDNSAYIEFTINEDLSLEKIQNLSNSFKQHLLYPFFNQIKE